MQDCQNCVHNNVCKEFASIGLFPNCKASTLVKKRVAGKDCDCVHFREEIKNNCDNQTEFVSIPIDKSCKR